MEPEPDGFGSDHNVPVPEDIGTGSDILWGTWVGDPDMVDSYDIAGYEI